MSPQHWPCDAATAAILYEQHLRIFDAEVDAALPTSHYRKIFLSYYFISDEEPSYFTSHVFIEHTADDFSRFR